MSRQRKQCFLSTTPQQKSPISFLLSMPEMISPSFSILLAWDTPFLTYKSPSSRNLHRPQNWGQNGRRISWTSEPGQWLWSPCRWSPRTVLISHTAAWTKNFFIWSGFFRTFLSWLCLASSSHWGWQIHVDPLSVFQRETHWDIEYCKLSMQFKIENNFRIFCHPSESGTRRVIRNQIVRKRSIFSSMAGY